MSIAFLQQRLLCATQGSYKILNINFQTFSFPNDTLLRSNTGTRAQPMHQHADIYQPLWQCSQMYHISKILLIYIGNICS